MAFPQTKIEIKDATTAELLANDPFAFITDMDWEQEFTEEQEIATAEFDREREGSERRVKRLTDCGNWGSWFDGHTGKRAGVVFRCNLYRECPHCLSIRAEKEHTWIMVKALQKDMIAVYMESKSATNKLRKVDKTDYIRYPQENGIDLVIIDNAVAERKEINGTPADCNWVQEQNWDKIVKTPKGRNKSGTMHIPPTPKDDEKFEMISIKQFTSNAPMDIKNSLMDKVIEETPHLLPKNAKEVKKAIDYRFSSTTKKLREAGYSYNTYAKKQKIVESKISWGSFNSVNSKNSTSDMSKEATVYPLQL